MRAFGFGPERAARRGRSGLLAPPPLPPAGFALNGSINPALRAALAAAAAGTGFATFVVKGDSTSVGAGSANLGNGTMTDVRFTRVPYILAAELTAAGYPTFDTALSGDNGASQTGTKLTAYDPRVVAHDWAVAADKSFAGGAIIGDGGSTIELTADGVGFEVVRYGNGQPGVWTVTVDGLASGFTLTKTRANGADSGSVAGNTIVGGGASTVQALYTIAGLAAGPHTIAISTDAGHVGGGALRSIRPIAAARIGFLVHASAGATSAQQAFTDGGWRNNDSLAFDQPALTVVNLGFNDMLQGVPTNAFAANLTAIVTAAKASGDVLLVASHPCGPGQTPDATQAAYRDAIASVAAAQGVAFFDQRTFFGSYAAIADQLDDGLHGKAAFQAGQAQAFRRGLQAMAT